MTARKPVCVPFVAFILSVTATCAQQPPAHSVLPAPRSGPQQSIPASKAIRLDVVVNTKSGQPVTGLGQHDFTLLDNRSPRPITSFRAVTPPGEPVEVILLIDDVNTPYPLLASVRNSVAKFLREDHGSLAYPTNIAVLTDNGVQVDNAFSSNGTALSDELKQRQMGLREITDTTQWGTVQRLTISVKALHQLVAFASEQPGRKIVLWISPGFPLSSGPSAAALPRQAEQAIFGDVVYFSTALRQNHITLYNINPVGNSLPMYAANYYQNFVKGAVKPDGVQLASLSIQVLSVQSGGLTLVSDNDVADMIQKCLLDAASWYEITFDSAPSDQANQYHHLEVRAAQPNVVVRTRDGYYSNPVAIAAAH